MDDHFPFSIFHLLWKMKITVCTRTLLAYCVAYTVVTGSIARSATRRYLIYSEADFEVFGPTGATRCTDGVKFGTEEGTCPLLRAKFHPHRCNDTGVGPPKLKFLLRFDQYVEYKRAAGRIPCAISTKFAVFVPHFRMR